MRRLLTGLVVAAITTVVPILALADNQEVANQIAKNLRNSGQLHNYKVAVKYQDGTAWLKGRVSNQEQMNSALKLVFETPGVTRVVNDLALNSPIAVSPSKSETTETAPAVLRPILAAGGALAPERISDAKRLEAAIADGSQRRACRGSAQPATGRRGGCAQRVPSSSDPMPVRTVAAMELQEASPNAMNVRVAGRPIPVAYTHPAAAVPGGPIPAYVQGMGGGVAPARYDQPCLPNYSWPSYAAYPNYGALTYPRQYSPTAWPFIGPFYPYPQVPLGWRKVTLEWDDGWWMLDFKD